MAIVFPEGTQNYPGDTTRGTEHALNTNSSVTWTSIPQHVQRITISWRSMSQSTNNRIKVRIGDNNGSYQSSGYEGTSQHINQSGGAGGRRESDAFEIYGPTNSYFNHGHATLTLLDDGQSDTWVWSFISGQYNSEHVSHGGGFKTLAPNYYLDKVQLFTSGGTFDSGFATLQYNF